MSPDNHSRRIAIESLAAQSSLMPYMVGAFLIGSVLFVPVGLGAGAIGWSVACLLAFFIDWTAFWAASRWLKRHPEASVEQRTRAHVMAGLLWSATLLPMTALADSAGPAREVLLLLCVGAAAVIAFFTATHLPSLLLVGPAAAAPPLIALHARGGANGLEDAALGGVALALALALILNRSLRRQFALTSEREALLLDRAAALAEAERLARSKSDLVATLSSEIRVGLINVEKALGDAAVGRRSRAGVSAGQLTAAHEVARELVSVLDVTLTSEEAESGRLALSLQPFDPFELVREVLTRQRPQAASKSLELIEHTEPGMEGVVCADPVRVRQIIDALVGNAVRYTVRGRIEVRLTSAGEALRIEVADTGPGLSAEELAQAFEPFSRIERTAMGVGGAGLGLSLSSRLARLMNAELHAESAVGVGSRFWLDLPFTTTPSIGRRDSPCPAPRPLRVLTAADAPLDAALLRSTLEQLGHQVLHAHNGQRAIDLLRRTEIDLALLDSTLPGLDGVEAIRLLRADARHDRLPIVAVVSGAEQARLCLDAGADAILRKPATAAAVARAAAEAVPARSRPVRAAA